MRVWLTVTMCAALLALGNLPFPLLAQQKTVKACQDEWRANKADNQAKGITEKAYVAQCRTGGQPTSAPTAIPAPPSAASPAPKKTVKACEDPRPVARRRPGALLSLFLFSRGRPMMNCRGGWANPRNVNNAWRR